MGLPPSQTPGHSEYLGWAGRGHEASPWHRLPDLPLHSPNPGSTITNHSAWARLLTWGLDYPLDFGEDRLHAPAQPGCAHSRRQDRHEAGRGLARLGIAGALWLAFLTSAQEVLRSQAGCELDYTGDKKTALGAAEQGAGAGGRWVRGKMPLPPPFGQVGAAFRGLEEVRCLLPSGSVGSGSSCVGRPGGQEEQTQGLP